MRVKNSKGEYFDIECVFSTQPTMITIPIEDYNRLRKLEIKYEN